MSDDTTETWKDSPFDPAAGSQRAAEKALEGLTTEEKVDRLAEAMMQLAETVERMADAQGASQQADTGSGRTGSKEALWGESSPFANGGRDD